MCQELPLKRFGALAKVGYWGLFFVVRCVPQGPPNLKALKPKQLEVSRVSSLQ